MQGFRSQVRQTLRTLTRPPLFFAGAVCTLALGIGANGAVFSIVQAVLLQPLPYRQPNTVVMVWRARAQPSSGTRSASRFDISRQILSPQMVFAVRSGSQDVLSDVAALKTWDGNPESEFDLVLADRAERLRGAFATPDFFEVLGVHAEVGRVFSSLDDEQRTPALVLSDALWRRAFGADQAIVGRPLTLIAGRPRSPHTFTVVGVLPAAFRFTYPDETEAWALSPWSDVEGYPRAGIAFQMVGRMRPGVTLAAAQARIAAIRTGLDHPNWPPNRQEALRVEPISAWVIGDARPSLLLLSAVALLLLLISCATVANSLLVRVTTRRRELALRASLGATPRHLVRQLLTESLLLSVGGVIAGTLLAMLVTPVLRRLVPSTMPRADEIHVSPWLLVFAAAMATVTTIVAGLAPAWRGARFDVVSALKQSGNTASADRTSRRWREAVVGVQAAVATGLLVSAILLLVSFWRLWHVPLGFDGNKVLTVEMRLMDQKYFGHRDANGVMIPSAALTAFQTELMTRVRALPGVLEAGLTSAVPFRGVDFTFVLNRLGDQTRVAGNGRFVDPGYFSVMRIPTLRGRLFSNADQTTSPKVVVISESYARAMFGAENPLGQVIEYDMPVTVIGVVGDVRYLSLDRPAQPAIYFPRDQWPENLMCLVARTAPRAGDLAPAVRHVIRTIDPSVPAMKLTTVDEILSESTADRRFYTTATIAFAAVALLLTVTGLVVVVARGVVERRREIAIRAALGATGPRLAEMMARQGVWPVFVGTGFGALVSYLGAAVLAPFLFQIPARTPWVYGAVGTLVLLVAIVATLVPARHVTGIAPAVALRAE